jgi:hypothetical protein
MTKRGVYALPQLSLPRLNDRPPTGSLMLDRQASRLCAMKHEIPIFRGQTRFSFRHRYPYLQLPMPCVPLHPPARRAIHSFQLCDRLCESAYRCISSYRHEASHPPMSGVLPTSYFV